MAKSLNENMSISTKSVFARPSFSLHVPSHRTERTRQQRELDKQCKVPPTLFWWNLSKYRALSIIERRSCHFCPQFETSLSVCFQALNRACQMFNGSPLHTAPWAPTWRERLSVIGTFCLCYSWWFNWMTDGGSDWFKNVHWMAGNNKDSSV